MAVDDLKESEEKYHKLVMNLMEGIYSATMNGELLDYNNEFMRNGFVKNYIVNAKRSDGEEIVVQVNSRLVKDKEGKPLRIEGFLLDITEQKQTEIALKESEERFHILSESTFEGIGIHDNGRIVDANKLLAEMLNLRCEELIGMNVAKLHFG